MSLYQELLPVLNLGSAFHFTVTVALFNAVFYLVSVFQYYRMHTALMKTHNERFRGTIAYFDSMPFRVSTVAVIGFSAKGPTVFRIILNILIQAIPVLSTVIFIGYVFLFICDGFIAVFNRMPKAFKRIFVEPIF